jgi:hypothetical protein
MHKGEGIDYEKYLSIWSASSQVYRENFEKKMYKEEGIVYERYLSIWSASSQG